MKKVAVGLSGGVDSAVAAALLVERKFDVTGVFLECWPPDAKAMGGKCRADEDRKDALAVALKLGIPFKVLDFKKEYKQKVVDYFYAEYKAGRTPNPDVMCNKEIKFGMFYDWCLENNFDYVATGHYAKIETGKLMIPKDKHKDQTYFLYRLRPEQLGHVLFPLGNWTKAEVRTEARKRGLPVADKPDSQGICFIGSSYAEASEGKGVKGFLKSLGLKEKKGKVVDTKGQVIGEHDGVWFYTVGQRHGFRTSGGRPPLYVISKDVKQNKLVVGFGAETYRSQFEISDLNWLANGKWHIANSRNIKVRIRHGGQLLHIDELKIENSLEIENCKLKIGLVEPQRGIASGQSAVFYDGEVMVGGGVID
jgi:tRNA-uridine 2-sulfurtransferase